MTFSIFLQLSVDAEYFETLSKRYPVTESNVTKATISPVKQSENSERPSKKLNKKTEKNLQKLFKYIREYKVSDVEKSI